jgi:hypothetical protein
MGKHWKFELGARVAIVVNGEKRETGEVISRAEHAFAEDAFNVRYVNGAGNSTEAWWTASALEPAN